MPTNEKISSRQLFILVLLFGIGTTILLVPGGLAAVAKQDAWIASLVGLGIGLPLIPLYIAIAKLYPRLNLFQLCEVILGKWLGKMVSILFFVYFFLLSSTILRQIGDFMTTQIMPETPIQFIHIIFITIVIMGTRLGLETFTRSAEIFFPWIIFLLVVTIIMISPEVEFNKILPIWEAGIKPLVRADIPYIGILFLELIVFLVIYPNVNQSEKAGRALYGGTIIAGIVTSVITFLTISVLGYSSTANKLYPIYTLAKIINIGHFIQRIEAVITGVWIVSIYYKLVICFYASSKGLAQILNLRQQRILTYPLGVITIVLSEVISPNVAYFQSVIVKNWTAYALTFGLFLPLLLLGVGKFRKGRATT
jgi:spore germination protein KB